MSKSPHDMPKPIMFVGTIVFVLCSLFQYYACWAGMTNILGNHFDKWVAVALLFVSYMFRLDPIVAVLGFYGEWKAFGLPLWMSLLVSSSYMILSLIINFGPRAQPRSKLIRGLWRRKNADAPSYVPNQRSTDKPPVTIDQTPIVVEQKKENQ